MFQLSGYRGSVPLFKGLFIPIYGIIDFLFCFMWVIEESPVFRFIAVTRWERNYLLVVT